MQTTSHQKMSLKHASCPPLPRGWNCKSWGWNGKTIFFHTGRSHCKWLLLRNFALMQLQNLHHIWINAIIFSLMQFHIDDSCASLSSAGGYQSDITVTPSVKCMEWLHRWYNHAALLVSSSTALAFPNNTIKKHKSYNGPNLRREHELHPGNITRGGHRKR